MGVAYDALSCSTEALDCYQQHLAIAHEISDLKGKRASILSYFPIQTQKFVRVRVDLDIFEP